MAGGILGESRRLKAESRDEWISFTLSSSYSVHIHIGDASEEISDPTGVRAVLVLESVNGAQGAMRGSS